ncbi:MAG: transposase [Proteobacteria bacterium]|nr:transposase [Pseudomonadota bacterium]MBU0974020.1 transposase [Pseudomonadota bacterium]
MRLMFCLFLLGPLVLSLLSRKESRPVWGTAAGKHPLLTSSSAICLQNPIILRKFFFYNRKLLSTLSKAAADSLQVFLRTVLGLKDGIFGAVLTIQTFGDSARWHPHIHAIVADGLFRRNGVFYVMPKTG